MHSTHVCIPNAGMPAGTPLALMEYGAFSEYGTAQAARAMRVPCPTPEVLALLTSGLTASIALVEVAGMGKAAGGKRLDVLVTAAAGDTRVWKGGGAHLRPHPLCILFAALDAFISFSQTTSSYAPQFLLEAHPAS